MEKLNELFAQQHELSKTIERFIINVGKDPIARKTLSYYHQKLNQLRELSSEFQKKHNELVELSDGESHSYFKTGYFAQVNEGIDQLIGKILTNISKLESAPAQSSVYAPGEPEILSTAPGTSMKFSNTVVSNQEENRSRLQALLNRRDSIIRLLNHSIQQINSRSTSQHSRQYFEMHIKSINDYWSSIAELNLSIWELTGMDSESAGYSMEEYYKLEELVHETVLQLAENQAVNNQQTHLKLPQITIPIFDGDYLKWQQFFDVYCQMIHNTTLPDSDKMFYLNSNLTGEAKSLVQHLPISNVNYAAAWGILTHRYNNKRILINTWLNKILSQPNIQSESAIAIRSLHDVTTECTLGLKSLGIAIESWDAILLHLLTNKLDKTTRSLYEQSLKQPYEPQTLKEFLEFLELRFQSLDALGYKGQHQSDKISYTKHQRTSHSKVSFTAISTQANCKICHEDHPIYYCSTFLHMTPHNRLKRIKDIKLCINCLKEGHFSQECTSRRCKECDKRHNTLVHGAFDNASGHRRGKPSVSAQSVKDKAIVGCGVQKNCHIFLATAIIQALDIYGQPIECRALLDSGSQVNLITTKLSKRLGTRFANSDMKLTGIGGLNQSVQKRATINIKSKSSSYSKMVEVFILDKIIGDQPNYNINARNFSLPQNIQLADPKFCESQEVDILIGAEFYSELMTIGQISANKNAPTLQNTVFGWVALGKATSVGISSQFCGISTLDDQLQRFWELDEMPTKETTMSTSEKECEEFFNKTTIQTKSGHFMVRLPFKQDVSTLGSSEEIAKRRFMALERKLIKNKQLQHEYIKFMEEYENLGHMELVDEQHIKEPNYFIPHHCVLKPSSTTTKLRVVFDASCKTSSKISLNQILHTGPKIQQDLFDVLIRFRQHKYVFTSDIAKMYRQIKMNDQDCNFQLIFWRSDPQHKLNIYRLKTVTYGTTSAPYIAIKCLQSVGKGTAINYPLASQMIKRDFYVDDLMSGSDDLNQAVLMQSEVINLLNSAGFTLRKWCANHKLLLKNVPPEDIERSLDITKDNEDIKTLGITWDPITDVIKIKTSWHDQKRLTKRTVLSDVAHIFDPIGLVSPVVIIAKIFIQELWKQKFDWDSSLPIHLHTKWLHFRHSLKQLNKISIPRHVRTSNSCIESTLHVFSDASERAFGAAIYMRSIDEHQTIEVKLLCSKSRVAPSKIITIPKLELQAAKLASELCHRVKNTLNYDDINIYYWTDSQIVLHWIHSESSSYKTFVANRISFIQRHSRQSHWRHVSSSENPADHISRGISPENLQNTEIWFHGPTFLKHPPSQWPGKFELMEEPAEERKCVKSVLTTVNDVDNFIFQINHKNSFSFVVRVVAYTMRFTAIVMGKAPRSHFLLMADIHKAFILIIKSLQRISFKEEINILERSDELDKKNRLSSLTPFSDENGLLRVGGRLEAANLSFDAKHPILLPADHVYTQLIMEELHVQHHHVGPQTLLSITRQRFWPINGKRIANKIVHRCMKCFKTRPLPMEQMMGNLPPARVQPSRPFLNTGVDFAGPIWTHLKLRGKRPLKSYIAVFCCFATKAIHLEIVSDLSADGFIGALRRFWSRRGRCQTIHSDNATNFVGGCNQLQELYEMFNNRQSAKKIHSECTEKGIEFQFIPPRAPHFGGLWESAVKSTKNLLFKTMKTASLTYEELCTVTAEIEAILNSRPITPVSSNPNDLTALTPAHFLIGEQLTTIPDPLVEDTKGNLVTRWRLVAYIKNEFWRRWQAEYISSLQHRYKWRSKCQNATPGLMVLIKEDNLPPTQWRLGRIENIFKGQDGLVRVAEVKTSYGTCKRPIHKLCPLPIEDNENLHGNRQESSVMDSKLENKPKKLSLNAVSAIILALLVFPSHVMATIQPTIEVTNFDSYPGIYFESLGLTNLINNEWHLVVYYDMKSYWEELQILDNGIENLNHLCNNIKNGTYCDSILMLFEQNLNDVKVYNEILRNSNESGRAKRGAFDIIGTVANRLFGVLDEQYAEKMADTIQTVDKNERTVFDLLNNHTILIEATTNVIRKTQEQINQQFEMFQKSIEDIQGQVDTLEDFFHQQQVEQMFSALAVKTLLAINNYQKTQSSLIDILTDSHHGKINPLLLTPLQLRTALLTIKDNLSPDLKLPFFGSSGTELSSIYNLLHVQGRVSKGHIIFRVQIPLASNNQFETFRMIPIPVKIGEEYATIQPSFPYLIVSLHRDLFCPMSEADAITCIKTISNISLCKQSQPIYNRNSNVCQCEVALLNHQPVQSTCTIRRTTQAQEWIQLFNPNHWIFSLIKNTTINIVCKDEHTSATLHGMGLLKILKNCVIKQDTLTITSHNVHPTQVRSSFTPTVDLYNFVNVMKFNKTQKHLIPVPVPKIPTDEIIEIQKHLEQIKSQQNEPEQLSTHDVHQYTVGYLGLVFGVIVAFTIVWSTVKTKLQRLRKKAPVPMPRSHSIDPDFTFNIDEQPVV